MYNYSAVIMYSTLYYDLLCTEYQLNNISTTMCCASMFATGHAASPGITQKQQG